MTQSMPPTRRAILGGLAAMPLAGCADPLALFAPSVEIYTLDPALPRVDPRSDTPWQLLVELPIAPAALDSSRIAVAGGDLRIDYLAGVSWSDRVPNLLQSLTVRAFERSGGIASVGPDVGGLRGDFVLKLGLERFQAVYDSGGFERLDAVAIDMTAKLVRMPRRDIVAGTAFTIREPVASEGTLGVIRAFNRATAALLPDVVDWTLAEIGSL